jgi:non-ribosomal peptide synthetase component F
LRLAFDAPRFDGAMASRLLAGVEQVLGEFVRDPARMLKSVSVIAPVERQQLLSTWNDTETHYPEDICIHHAIEQQVEKNPDAVAIVSRGQEYSYSELNASANQLAHNLLGCGVGPDVPVGILAERNVNLIIAMLAIHKAGGCYLPLDPEYPSARLRFMIEDSQAPVLISEAGLRSLLPDYDGRVVTVDATDHNFDDFPAHNPAGRTSSADLAYLIYTSGSTGTPKGVMVEHRNVLNFFTAMDEKVPLKDGQPGTWLAVTSLSFDISVLELLWTLARGFRVVLHEDQQRAAVQGARPGEHANKSMQFSLMYFSSSDTAGGDKYRLLM